MEFDGVESVHKVVKREVEAHLAGPAVAVVEGASGVNGSVAIAGLSSYFTNVAMVDSMHGATASSGDEPSTDSRMCTEESIERMTNSMEGMLSLSEDSSGRDTYAQAHDVGQWNSDIYESQIVQPQFELSDSDEQMNGILGSYREILVDDIEADQCDRNALIGDDTEEEVSNLSPDSAPTSPLDGEDCVIGDSDEPEANGLGVRRPNSLKLSYNEVINRAKSCGGRRLTEHESKHMHKQVLVGSAPAAIYNISESTSGLEGLPGVVSRDGDLVSFVAQDLQEQIKRASPIIKRGETPSFPQSRSSTPSLYKTVLTPQLQLVDPNILQDIENKARAVASSVDTILENLTGTLHSMSSLTVDCVDVYEEVVNKTCDSIDGNIKGMYQLMAKFEELGNLMRPLYKLSGHIKEIKRMLDLFEQVCSASS
ncbi:hypothetical protein CHUAL_010403 [Chamberlinius hualienensis]